LTRDEKIALCRKLQSEGLGCPRIGTILGVSRSTVYKWLHPEKVRADNAKRHEVKLAWQRAQDRSEQGRARCSECGGLAGVGSARHGPTTCAECRGYAAALKGVRVERLWNEGKTFPEICAEMGWTSGMLSRMIDQYRADGYDLPYRYKTGRRAGHKFPEQVAA
jgi:transposase